MSNRTPILTEEEAIALGERVEELLENTEDWNVTPEEYDGAIVFWTDILDKLGEHMKARRIRIEHGVDSGT